jgi:hypothetical protein
LFYTERKAPPKTPPRAQQQPNAPTPSPGARPTTPAPAANAGNRPSPSDGRPPAAPAPAASPVLANATYVPLGLRYGILKKSNSGDFSEVDVDTTFHTDDGIRVNVESNDDAYLYIVNQGSTGTWSLLFPSPEIDNGNNRVQARRRTVVPARGQFTFADQAGDERLLIILTREAEPDLEKLIYSLRQPQSTPDRPDQSKFLMVQNTPIDNAVVQQIRNTVMPRDLVFEKIIDDPSPRKEKAAYVVNSSLGLDSRVVADLILKHFPK